MRLLTKYHFIALIGIVFIGLNLRAPFTSLAPLIDQLMASLHLASWTLGVITSLPLVMFAIISPLSPKIINKIGVEKTLCLGLLMILVGILLRSSGTVWGLFLGTTLIGSGIAFGNVVLPVIVKLNFPTQIGIVTSIYTLTMGASAALSSASMIPISYLSPDGINSWQFALTFNSILPLIALLIWLPKLTNAKKQPTNQENHYYPLAKLLKQPMAWFITLALGLNSFIFYTFAGWLPKILIDWSFSELDAGYIYGVLQFATMLPPLILIPLMARGISSYLLVKITSCISFLAVIGLLLTPQLALFWVVIFGMGNCSTFIIILSFLSIKTNSAAQSAALSGMAQSLGYALAAIGPGLIGWIYGHSHTWHLSLVIIAGAAFTCFIFSWLTSIDKPLG